MGQFAPGPASGRRLTDRRTDLDGISARREGVKRVRDARKAIEAAYGGGR
jgi:hypothetical protein